MHPAGSDRPDRPNTKHQLMACSSSMSRSRQSLVSSLLVPLSSIGIRSPRPSPSGDFATSPRSGRRVQKTSSYLEPTKLIPQFKSYSCKVDWTPAQKRTADATSVLFLQRCVFANVRIICLLRPPSIHRRRVSTHSTGWWRFSHGLLR